MQDKKEDREGPLSSEAAARDDWRGGEASLSPRDAPGHSLPESERDSAADQDAGRSSGPIPGTIFPPD